MRAKTIYEQYLDQRDIQNARMLKWERFGQILCWIAIVSLIFLGGM